MDSLDSGNHGPFCVVKNVQLVNKSYRVEP